MTEAWKYFIIEITYLIPADQMIETTKEHRAFLKEGYDRGWLLLSGPQEPRTGGVIVCRAPLRKDLESFFSNDPYLLKSLAVFRYIEFHPVFRQGFLENWMMQEPG